MRLKKYKIVLFIMVITSLLGCAPTEEEKKQAEEIEKNKPSISIQPVSALTEPDEGLASYSATISMSKTIEDNVTVHYSLNPKTATAGDDFQAQSGVLTIPSGSNSATIELVILADDIDEQDEEFTITLSSPTNAKLGVATEIVVIKDSANDLAKVSFVTGNATVPERSAEYKIKLRLSNPSEKEINTESLTIYWETNIASNTVVQYGLTPALEIDTMVNASMTTQ
ncbi:MAG: Calx-beta domain-containing protein, partial [Moritella sp.]|uniref:Calx-beta domain-containing protein n=1 Tax=Moritella sp. TaxID=78556 RepID=UPI0029A659D4